MTQGGSLAFAAAGPLLRQGDTSTVQAIRLGKEDRYEEEDREKEKEASVLAKSAVDAWSQGRQSAYQAAIGKLAVLNPDHATQLQTTFGEMDKTNFNESGYHIYNAARADIHNIEAQDKSLERARDALGVRPDHPFAQGINEILAMPVKTDKERAARASVIRDTLEMAKAWNAFGGYFLEKEGYATARGAKAPTATDVDDYERLISEQWEIDNPDKGPMPPGLKADARMRYKREQEEEAYFTKLAEQRATQETAQQIAFNSKFGEQLAVIKTAYDVIKARGEDTKIETRERAQGNVSGKLSTLGQHYFRLDQMGGIVNVDKPAMDNIYASARASGLGQVIGKYIGADEQSLRNKIKAMKPLLMNDIRQASEMGVRGLDSQKELEFYLQASTDETRDFQSNLAAIAVLDRAYGTGQLAAAYERTYGTGNLEGLQAEWQAAAGALAPAVQPVQPGQPGQPGQQPTEQPGMIEGMPADSPVLQPAGPAPGPAPTPAASAVTLIPGEPTAKGANGEILVVRNNQWVPVTQ